MPSIGSFDRTFASLDTDKTGLILPHVFEEGVIAAGVSVGKQMLTNAAQHKAMVQQEHRVHKMMAEAGKEKDFAAAAKKRRDAN